MNGPVCVCVHPHVNCGYEIIDMVYLVYIITINIDKIITIIW